jgi:U3 small nucleolar RNA-associated protein 10
MLIRCVVSEETIPEAPIARRLLSVIKQRYPNVLSEMADTVSEESEDVRASVEQLIISLSMVRSL